MNTATQIETDYFTEIEAAFAQKRGKMTTLNSLDFQLMQSWEARSIPLQIVVRGIETAFKSAKNNDIGTLRYCEKAVNAAFAEWQTGQTGSHEHLSKPDVVVIAPTTDESEKVRAKLAKLLDSLREFHAAEVRAAAQRPRLLEAVARLGKEVKKLLTVKSNHRNFLGIEAVLEKLDEELTDALKCALSAEEHAAITDETAQPLDKIKSRWTREIYNSTFHAIFTKNVREHFAAPHLTLFQ